uniref:Right handed beta helix domain-containing protein n=2 Tax=Candidatus Methanogaster sp. ANME-2c ERB4 TaxID=2759911 RepID=A0A7G9YQ17_9EURY|nr:hypothetical protein GDOAKEED_00005 [Methanosarcinales archaeon ANME-2c ERB4]
MAGETGMLKIGYLVAVLVIFGIGFIGTASALDPGDGGKVGSDMMRAEVAWGGGCGTLVNGTISTDTTWTVAGSPYIVTDESLTVSDNVALTLEPGVVVKFESENSGMCVWGTLNASGTSDNRIVFTSLKDDSYGGDTNADGGATAPAPGDWGHLRLYGPGAYDGIGIFDHCIVRYGGNSNSYPANIHSYASDSFSFDNSVSEYSEKNGIYSYYSNTVISNSTFNNNGIHGLYTSIGSLIVTNNTFDHNNDHGFCSDGSTLSVTNNTFTNNTNYATYLSRVNITSFRDNKCSGNGVHGWGVSGTVPTSQTWEQYIPYVILNAGLTVNGDVALTLEPGVVVKFESENSGMCVWGTLNASGTSDNKIIFTSLKDDSYGGDTNADGGATAPAPGDWGYLRLYGPGAYDGIGIFDHCIVRYGGNSNSYPANIHSYASDSFSFDNSVSEYSEKNGIHSYYSNTVISNSTFNNNGIHGLYTSIGSLIVTNNTFDHNNDHGFCSDGSTLSVTNNTFTNNTNYATYLSGVTITSFRDNKCSGNGVHGWGVSGTVPTSQTWEQYIPYVILNAGLTVNGDVTLTLEPGVVVKFESENSGMCVWGTLNASGTSDNRIVFTSLKDDSYGGDTNADGGATAPKPGDWGHLRLYGPGAYDGIGIFDHCIVRYGGNSNSYPANIHSYASDSFSFDNSVSEYSEKNGIYSYHSNTVISNSTFNNNGIHGLYTSIGSLIVTNNTFDHNNDHGFCSDGSTLSVTNNTFTNNTNYATYLSGVNITSFRDNKCSGNGVHGWGVSGTVPTSQTWEQYIPYVILNAGLTVNGDVTLTLEPGVVVKFESENSGMCVWGTLNASGTPDNKIIFTSLKDDSYGGDTNADGGATAPAPGDWGHLRLYGPGAYDGIGIFDHCIVRYGGNSNSYPANIHSYASDSFSFDNSVSEYSEKNGIYSYYSNTVISNSTIRSSSSNGIYLAGTSTPHIRYTNMYNNSEYNIYNAHSSDITAPNNWWGTTDTDAINDSIYDHYDAPSCGIVYYNPYLNAPAGTTDTTPPTLAINSPAPNTTTHMPTITIAGTASDPSGIASVTVNGEPADGTLDWSANVTLSEGENTIIVIATDGAGLTATTTVTVHYKRLKGDLNSDGILTPADAAIALEIAAGSRPCDAAMLAAADVSGDGCVTSLDALMILQGCG